MVELANTRAPNNDSLVNSKQLINMRPRSQGNERWEGYLWQEGKDMVLGEFGLCYYETCSLSAAK